MHLVKGSEAASLDVDALVPQGWELMRRRNWAAARDAFERAIRARDPHAGAREGLAAAALCLDDLATARAAYERAYREYLDLGDPRGAARVATQLAMYHESYRGEPAIASGWFERAQSLLDAVPVSPEHAWLAFWKAHVEIHLHGDLIRGERHLEEALRLSEACSAGGEIDLLARGLTGLMLIGEGRIEDGLRRLDETTTAAVAGELTTPGTVGWAYCYILDACENVRDFGRAAEWMHRAFEDVGELGVRHYTGFCRSHFIGVLTWRGEYARAEQEIATMRGELAGVAPVYQSHADVRLGEIYRRQGRLDEAAAILEPHAHTPLAMISLAALALDTERPQAALELTERYLRCVAPRDRVRRLHGLDLLVRGHAAAGNVPALASALAEVEAVAERSATPLMQAIICEARAFAAEAAGGADVARRTLEDAVDQYDRGGAPYEATAARLRLAEVLRRDGRADSTVRILEAASAAAARLGAGRLAGRAAAALARIRPARGRPRVAGLTGRELEILALVAQGVSNQEIGARLSISGFTVKRHIANMLTKLNLPTRAAAAAFAVRERLVE